MGLTRISHWQLFVASDSFRESGRLQLLPEMEQIPGIGGRVQPIDCGGVERPRRFYRIRVLDPALG